MKVKVPAPKSMLPILMALAFAAACGDSTTAASSTAKVRFFTGVWNAQDNIGFTANDKLPPGGSLGYLQQSSSCASLDPGNTSFAIGLANASGTALNSEKFVTMPSTLTAGGNYIVLAGGNLIHPSLVLLDNNFTGTLGPNEAAVRFVNLAASVEGPVTISKGSGSSATLVRAGLEFRDATSFGVVPSGSNAYTITYANTSPVITGSEGMLDLKAGSVNTIVLSRLNPPDGAFKLITVPSCS